MKIIISPAKKMNTDTDSLPVTSLPAFLERTRVLCRAVQALSYEEARALWKCNDRLAKLNYRRFMEMDLEGNLTPAVLSYEGLQYQHMAPRVFTRAALDYLDGHLRILSGFYGVLRPFDGVTPYRLEMQAGLSADGAGNLYDFWGSRLYEEIIRGETADKGDAGKGPIILNLASKEYSAAVSPYLKPGDRFVSCVFGQLQGGKIRQKATLAKMARGEMVRFMAERQVKELDELREFDALGFSYAEEFSRDNELVFLCPAKARGEIKTGNKQDVGRM